jgi:carbamoyl-phosphate synthase large subunit
MNVLITSAGRRTGLLTAFMKAAHRREARVVAGDMDGLAPSLFLADQGVRLPPVDDPDFLACLGEIVREQRIRLIIPTIDTELPLLAEHAGLFRNTGCEVLVSSCGLVELASDKWKTLQAFAQRGFRIIRSWLPGEDDLSALPPRLFLKPRSGSASQHAYAVTREEVRGLLARVPDPLIQEHIGGPEITVDALIDFHGKILHYVPRRRIRTCGGESIQAVTLPPDEIHDWIMRALQIVSDFGGRGPITLQAFLTGEGPLLSEINPRFGGGFPLTLAAGGEYPEWILTLLEGKSPPARLGDYRAGLYMTRSYTEYLTEHPLWD